MKETKEQSDRENAEQTRKPNKPHLHNLRQLSINLLQINNLLPPLQALRIPISRTGQIPINPLPMLLIRVLRAETLLHKLPAASAATVLTSTMPDSLRTNELLNRLPPPQNLDLMLPIIAIIVSVRPRRIPQRKMSKNIPEPQLVGPQPEVIVVVHWLVVVEFRHVVRLGLNLRVDEGDEQLVSARARPDGSVAGAEVVRVGVCPAEGGLQGSVQGGEGAAGGACEDAVDFGGPHGEEGDFDGDAPCFEGSVFAFGRMAELSVFFSIVKVAAKVCDV